MGKRFVVHRLVLLCLSGYSEASGRSDPARGTNRVVRSRITSFSALLTCSWDSGSSADVAWCGGGGEGRTMHMRVHPFGWELDGKIVS